MTTFKRSIHAVAIAAALLHNAAFADELLLFDIVEDGTRFVFDQEHRFADGLPSYGNIFTTQGYIYPPGTVQCAADGTCNGVLEDGSPEFPNQVIGEWTCWGTHVGDGAHTVSGPWVVTSQQFDLGEQFGEKTIITNGYELVDLQVPIKRAIQGGTGEYAGAQGEQLQSLVGFNDSFGVVIRTKLKVDNDD